jgi:membrane protein DedA with SNARE-associated domain
VRSLVSVPAALTGMPAGRFTALTATGAGLWNATFLALGYALGTRAEAIAGRLDKALLAGLVVGVVFVAVRWRRKRRPELIGF